MIRKPAIVAANFIILAVLASGCHQPVENTRVENDALGICLATLPSGFEAAENDGSTLILKTRDPALNGTLSFDLGPEEQGINLVAAMTAHRQSIEAKPGGEYLGGQELVGPFGSAFYSRGRSSVGTEPTEETRVFTIDPGGNRMLTITYEYPAANDSAERVNSLMEVFAVLEPITAE